MISDITNFKIIFSKTDTQILHCLELDLHYNIYQKVKMLLSRVQ